LAEYKVTCPKSNRHKRFSVSAHVAQEWQVDEAAEFVKVLDECLDVTHRPQQGDRFVCMTCGAEAKVE
jgi:hypothetical protein